MQRWKDRHVSTSARAVRPGDEGGDAGLSAPPGGSAVLATSSSVSSSSKASDATRRLKSEAILFAITVPLRWCCLLAMLSTSQWVPPVLRCAENASENRPQWKSSCRYVSSSGRTVRQRPYLFNAESAFKAGPKTRNKGAAIRMLRIA